MKLILFVKIKLNQGVCVIQLFARDALYIVALSQGAEVYAFKNAVSVNILSQQQVATDYTRKNLTTCGKPMQASRQRQLVGFALLPDIIRLVARLFQQVPYSHDITILLKPCLMILLLRHDCTRLVRTTFSCYKSNNAIKLITSC